MTWLRDAEEGWRWVADPSIVLSAGPSRSRDAEDDDETFTPPPFLGFAVEPCPSCHGEGQIVEGVTCFRCAGGRWVTW